MSGKLYRVELEGVVYVVADDEREAEVLAGALSNEIEDWSVSASVPDSLEDIRRDGWGGEVRPFTDDGGAGYEPDDPTCEQLFARRFGACIVQKCSNFRTSEDAEVCDWHAETKRMF